MSILSEVAKIMIIGTMIAVQTILALFKYKPQAVKFFVAYAVGTNDSSAPLSPYMIAKAKTLISIFPMPTPPRRAGSSSLPIKNVLTSCTNK